MKISGVYTSKVIDLYSENKRVVSKKEVAKKSDSLQISNVGKSLSNIDINGIDFDSSKEKIERIKNEIQNGTYKCNGELTAKKIIDIIKNRGV